MLHLLMPLRQTASVIYSIVKGPLNADRGASVNRSILNGPVLDLKSQKGLRYSYY